ncbi:MAG TPA: GC-type dockerin domain-anchored protein [Phycisphaerales bacterium]|nr:GC-type dockerin domain-anchored protein [Phycisphaerales bacterium]
MRPLSFCVAVVSLGSTALAQSPVLHDIGPVTPGAAGSFAMAVNARGDTVVGFGPGTSGSDLAFRWTLAGGVETLPGGNAAFAVSANGSVATGRGGLAAIRWVGLTAQDLQVAPGGTVAAVGTGISGDGMAIVGSATTNQAFRWTPSTGSQWLALPTGATNSGASAISAVGLMVAGSVRTSGRDHAYRWSDGPSGLDLGTLSGGLSSVATAISADGSALAGYGDTASAAAHAFRWTASSGIADLGTLPGTVDSFAFGIGADGSAVVGYATLGTSERAFLWTPALGMVELSQYLAGLGVDLTGWQLNRAQAISADGTAIVGYGVYGIHTHGYVITGLNLGFCPSILIGPGSATACSTGSAGFSVYAAGAASPLTYQWQIEAPAGQWQTLGNDPGPLPCGGGAHAFAFPINSPSVALGISPCPGQNGLAQHINVRCVVANQCGTATSPTSIYTICPADFDCLGGLTVGDIFAYLNAWLAGDPQADTNGGGLAVQDIFDFLNAWFAGCG